MTAPTIVSGTSSSPSREYVATDVRAPTDRAACHQRKAEGDPVTARSGPRSSPTSSPRRCGGGCAEKTTAGRQVVDDDRAELTLTPIGETTLRSARALLHDRLGKLLADMPTPEVDARARTARRRTTGRRRPDSDPDDPKTQSRRADSNRGPHHYE
jgi:hypothetical protein